MSMTVKELAEACGVSKVSILNKLSALNLRSECTKEGNRLVIPDKVVKAVTEAYKGKSEEAGADDKRTVEEQSKTSSAEPKESKKSDSNSKDNADILTALYRELDLLHDNLKILNKELEEKNELIKDLRAENRQYVQVHAQLLLTGAVNKPEPVEADFTAEETEEAQEEKRGFFSKLFKK